MSKDPSRSWDTLTIIDGYLVVYLVTLVLAQYYKQVPVTNTILKGFALLTVITLTHALNEKFNTQQVLVTFFKEFKFQSTYKNARFSNNPYNATL